MRAAWLVMITVIVSAAGCGGKADEEPSLVGTWEAVSIGVLGRHTDCPGEMEVWEDISVSCPTQTITFRADGTYLDIITTDETGAAYLWRGEGTWSVDEDFVTIEVTREGPTPSTMIEMPEPSTFRWMWSVTGDTLTMGWTISFVEIEATFLRM